MSNRQQKLGGYGRVVEIDESLLVRRKYNRGRRLATNNRHVWVFGGIEHAEQPVEKVKGRVKPPSLTNAFAVRVHNRKAKTLDHIIMKLIAPGTVIMTDSAAVYRNLTKRLGNDYFHFCVKHSTGEFVGRTDKSVYTNTVENLWRNLKKKIDSYKHNDALDLAVAEYLYRRVNFVKDPMDDGTNFRTFLSHIAMVYPGTGVEPLRLMEVTPSELQDAISDNDSSDHTIDIAQGDDTPHVSPRPSAQRHGAPGKGLNKVNMPPDVDIVIAQHLPANFLDTQRVTTVCRVDIYAGALRCLFCTPTDDMDAGP